MLNFIAIFFVGWTVQEEWLLRETVTSTASEPQSRQIPEGLRLPTLGIAGSEDGATPPDLVRETVDLVPGSQFSLIRNAGHLPCVEHPQEYAALLTEFLQSVGHV